MTRGPFFTTSNENGVETLRFHHREQLAGPDLSMIHELWSFLESQENRPARVLLIHAPSHLMTPQNMDAFWRPMIEAHDEGPTGDLGTPVTTAQLSLGREEHALQRFIQQIRCTPALVIGVFQGEIDFPFLGPALACDYRIVAEDTAFVNRTMDLELPPMGATPWFLTHFLGQGRAMEVLLNPGSITAAEAYELNLVNEVVPLIDLEPRARQMAQSFASKSGEVLVALKRSTVASDKTLAEYLGEETRAFERWVKNDKRLSTNS